MKKYGIKVLVYLDEFLVIAQTEEECRQAMNKLIALIRGLGLQNQLGETNTANEQSQISGSHSMFFNLDGINSRRESYTIAGGVAINQSINQSLIQETSVPGGQIKLLRLSSECSPHLYASNAQLLAVEETGLSRRGGTQREFTEGNRLVVKQHWNTLLASLLC